MTILRAMVTIPRDSGIPADAVTNTWHFNTGGALLPTDAGIVRDRLAEFYNNPNTVNSVAQYLSRVLDGDGARIKVYDLSNPEPRVPVLDVGMPIGPITAEAIVSEVAICLSYHADFVSGAPRARRRGRIFLGPLASNVMSFSFGEPRPSPEVRGDLKLAAERLIAADTPLLKWSVYSPTANTAAAPIVGGWIDNAFDTQRRRGVRPTTRTTILAG